MRSKKNRKYYQLDEILSKGAYYNMIFGERSNGKTYSALKYALVNYINTGKQFALVRRTDEDFKKGSNTMFDSLVANGEIEKLTNGEWTGVKHTAGKWYLTRYDEDLAKDVRDDTPFALAFAISLAERYKSSSFPNITTVIFDEFLSRKGYLNNEFIEFLNILSTIIRDRKDVKIFMLGNTVNKHSPYFSEMGLKNVAKMKQGDIDVYHYGDSGLTVAVEYSDSPNKGKPSDVYFAFDNPKLNMITNGVWEMAVYPHCPCKYLPKDILFKYFIIFDGNILQCDVIQSNDMLFTFIHLKTTPIRNEDTDLVYTTSHSPRPNFRRKITKPSSNMERKLAQFFVNDKVFYQDNEIGEIVRNYLIWCKNDRVD